ncbi:UDP-glucose 4-epimerase GalE [Chitinimonas sp. BJB300]|uniref:UDP-glucose 4-epimerase GalE n=1 Tax=Chitinimonas sp. BJB300 TaxID=1559339 RepID=UPI000C0F86E4|nr:UDP-glucose 4-epimerase GalE [Chitinimonas sp. BJB300]PHV11147.1 UDP-glucose 4-epimerase GalE [Chitinimonas sp. BJB300]TSJ85569.1 UDP-glucose 4-epimerase GalE [Chitinimonas sp. BJB300]
MKKVLLTGGAGYIGSHTCLVLLEAGYQVVVVDNYCNSKPISLDRVSRLTGQPIVVHQLDVRDEIALESVFAEHAFDAVIHFAGLKAVGESVEKPLDYYDNNVNGSLALLRVMARRKVKTLVFSSSATVYGDPATVPIREDFPTSPTNPYGRSKLMVEEILRDHHHAQADWGIALLRYFNPVGAHPSGEIGEDPSGIPNNLMPYVAQVAGGRREVVSVFGNDYPTPDGTGVRDYIHVMDLALGHLRALEALLSKPRLLTLNLGTGTGYSVLEMIRAFETASGRPIPYQVTSRRPGDIATCYADPDAAMREIGWCAELGLEAMCAHSWRWQSRNPQGYVAE